MTTDRPMVPPHHHNTSSLSWAVLALLIAAIGFGVWSIHDTKTYLDSRRNAADVRAGVTAADLQTLRVGICGFLTSPKAQRDPVVIAFEHRLWRVYGQPSTVLCPPTESVQH